MLTKEPVEWKQIDREIIHPNGGASKTIEKWVFEPRNDATLEIDNKTGEHFWVTGKGEDDNRSTYCPANNKYTFRCSDLIPRYKKTN
jgi:hypothetical protein